MAIARYDIKFLESATNAREMIHRSTGHRPNSALGREIAACVQQGRLFFESADTAPIQIRPLLVYYGIVGLARAVIVATKNKSLSTLTPSHGLTDRTPPNGRIESLTVHFENKGTFQEFNDAIAPLGRVCYFKNAMPSWFKKPFDKASGLGGSDISLIELFSRCPGVAEKYSQTFGSPSKTLPIMLDLDRADLGRWTLRIDDPTLYDDRSSLLETVCKWRKDYPFLDRWRFIEANLAWGKSVLIFDNAAKKDEDEFSESNITQFSNNSFQISRNKIENNVEFTPVEQILPPLSGGYIGAPPIHAIQPILGINLPEYSIYFLGAFLLSSLVRYRPQIWQNAISRSVTQQAPADDRAIFLIESFLEEVLNGFPDMVMHLFDYQRII